MSYSLPSCRITFSFYRSIPSPRARPQAKAIHNHKLNFIFISVVRLENLMKDKKLAKLMTASLQRKSFLYVTVTFISISAIIVPIAISFSILNYVMLMVNSKESNECLIRICFCRNSMKMKIHIDYCIKISGK